MLQSTWFYLVFDRSEPMVASTRSVIGFMYTGKKHNCFVSKLVSMRLLNPDTQPGFPIFSSSFFKFLFFILLPIKSEFYLSLPVLQHTKVCKRNSLKS
jgi:hypothetical protein